MAMCVFLMDARDLKDGRLQITVKRVDLPFFITKASVRDAVRCEDPVHFFWNAETPQTEKKSALAKLVIKAFESGRKEVFFNTGLQKTIYRNGIANDPVKRQRQFLKALHRIEGLYCNRELAEKGLAAWLDLLAENENVDDLFMPFTEYRDEGDELMKALEPDLNLKGRVYLPWVDYTKEERELMIQKTMAIFGDGRESEAIEAVDAAIYEVKRNCAKHMEYLKLATHMEYLKLATGSM